MRIEFLWFDDCPNHKVARELLAELLEEHGIETEIEDVNVSDVETGERVKFAGSPTIRVDGVDVDPGYEDTGDYTPRCRLYQTRNGLRGVPEREWIESALDAASRAARA